MWIAALGILFGVAILMRIRRGATARADQRLQIGFVHPDLGIGGAERLVLDAALALVSKGHQVVIYTAHYSPQHCFEDSRTLDIRVYGDWIPRSLLGRCVAVFAYIRMIYAALALCLVGEPSHVIFCDQISACIPVLRLTKSRILFYCHFPDKLLSRRSSLLKRVYRWPIDKLEEVTTAMAHQVLVNSEFTQATVCEAFPSLSSATLRVLYPAINIAKLQKDSSRAEECAELNDLNARHNGNVILSVNRFERKKNIQLVMSAFSQLKSKMGQDRFAEQRLVIAGGYDPLNSENKQVFEELVHQAEESGFSWCALLQADSKIPREGYLADASESGNATAQVWFMPSFSNQQKAALLKKCVCVVYSPTGEHFGIVPIEAMALSRPVVACDSGGPKESVVNGQTGFLCPPDPNEFADALFQILNSSPSEQQRMGDACLEHVTNKFGFSEFGHQLHQIVLELSQPTPATSPQSSPLLKPKSPGLKKMD